ncbi:hypothetical protein FMN50_18275 [Rhodobacterales bacterium]|nr:hypothetical protein FMN50_18275 [Rhodobacterales bacterium]
MAYETSRSFGQCRSSNRSETSHHFTVGQVVRLKSPLPMRTTKPGDTYFITGTLPASNGQPQYRIRNKAEGHERVMTEDLLQIVAVSTDDRSNALLIEKTFGKS